MTASKALADYFEVTARCGAPAKIAANWIMSELLRELNADSRGVEDCPVSPEAWPP